MDYIDKHVSTSSRTPIHRIAFSFPAIELSEYISNRIPEKNRNEVSKNLATRVLQSDLFCDGENVWFIYQAISLKKGFELYFSGDEIKNILSLQEWQMLWSSLTGMSGVDLNNHWIPQTLDCLKCIPGEPPAIEVIPTIRKIGTSGSQASDFSGEGIIERLAKI